MATLSKATLDAIAAAVAGAVAAALTPATGSVVAPAAHIGPSGKADGRRFPCTLGCGRLLRSAKRAAVHGVDAGGHTAAA